MQALHSQPGVSQSLTCKSLISSSPVVREECVRCISTPLTRDESRIVGLEKQEKQQNKEHRDRNNGRTDVCLTSISFFSSSRHHSPKRLMVAGDANCNEVTSKIRLTLFRSKSILSPDGRVST